MQWKWNPVHLILLNCLFILYGKNTALDYIIIVLATALLIYGMKHKCFYQTYFCIMFFEPVLNLPFGGSYFRIFEALFGVELFFQYAKKPEKWKRIGITRYVCFGLYFILISFLYVNSAAESISVFLNVAIIVYCAIQMSKSKGNREIALTTIGVSAMFSGIYGLLNKNGLSFEYGIRYSGTINDPNYSALFFILGIIAMLGTSLLGKKIRWGVIGVLLLALLRTISLSGICIGALSIMLFMFLNKPKRVFLYTIGVIVAFLLFMTIDLPQSSVAYGIQYRLRNAFSLIDAQNYGTLTSSRSDTGKIFLEIFRENSFWNQMFGGLNTVEGDYRDYCVARAGYVSHNSIIDMLFMTGIFFTVITLFVCVKRVCNYYSFSRRYQDKTWLALTMLKVSALMMSCTISIFPFRYFYTVMLL